MRVAWAWQVRASSVRVLAPTLWHTGPGTTVHVSGHGGGSGFLLSCLGEVANWGPLESPLRRAIIFVSTQKKNMLGRMGSLDFESEWKPISKVYLVLIKISV